MWIDTLTRAVVKLVSDGNGGGGVQTFREDMDTNQIHVGSSTYDGEQREAFPMGPPG